MRKAICLILALTILLIPYVSASASGTMLYSYEDAERELKRQIEAGEEEFTLNCSESLYQYLVNDSPKQLKPVFDLTAGAGLTGYYSYYTYDYSSYTFTFNMDTFYPGTRIIRYASSGMFSELSAREKATYQAALKMAQDCQRSTPLETARAIHDALCRHIVYTVDESTEEDDTAIGAILNGQANCDGYTDAFYLVGTLAGLTVRHQCGNVYEYDTSYGYSDSHLWNLLYLDGSWRVVDVTWDDQKDGDPVYLWFNIGYDRITRTHFWNESCSPAIISRTPAYERPDNEYSVRNVSEALSLMPSAARQYPNGLTFVFDSPVTRQSCSELIDAFINSTGMGCYSSVNERMQTFTIYVR